MEVYPDKMEFVKSESGKPGFEENTLEGFVLLSLFASLALEPIYWKGKDDNVGFLKIQSLFFS